MQEKQRDCLAWWMSKLAAKTFFFSRHSRWVLSVHLWWAAKRQIRLKISLSQAKKVWDHFPTEDSFAKFQFSSLLFFRNICWCPNGWLDKRQVSCKLLASLSWGLIQIVPSQLFLPLPSSSSPSFCFTTTTKKWAQKGKIKSSILLARSRHDKMIMEPKSLFKNCQPGRLQQAACKLPTWTYVDKKICMLGREEQKRRGGRP